MAVMSLFTVELRSQSGSISHNFSAALSIAERISVRSFVCISLVPRSSSSSSSSSAVQSIVGPRLKVLQWTAAGSDFLKCDAHRISTVKTNFFYCFAYLLDRHIQSVTICTIILVAWPNFMPHPFIHTT